MARNNSAQAAVTFSGGGAGTGTQNSVQINAPATAGGTSVLLPLGPDGKVVRAVWLQTNAVAYIRLQMGVGNNATVNDVQLSPNNPIVAIVGPYTALAAMSASGTAMLNISGVEIG